MKMKVDNKMMKTLTTIFMKSKKSIIDHAPQIMAVAGCGCFMAATYCAVKETPKALEKLEEKKALDPDMSVLQKAAVLVPEFKGCISFTTLGLGLSFGAWKVESIRFAEMSAVAAAALKDNERLIDAAKSVVGEEETKKIETKAEEMKASDYELGEISNVTPDDIPYPFLFDNGTVTWLTWGKFKNHLLHVLTPKVASEKGIKVSDYFEGLLTNAELITDNMKDSGWQPTPGEYADNDNADSWIRWASEMLGYSSEPYEYDRYRHISGWKIHWDVKPEKWDPHLVG